MMRYVRDAGGRARGVVWYQGESDHGVDQRRVYGRSFRRYVADLRDALKDRDLPVITTQLNRHVGVPDPQTNRGWDSIRQTQRQLAAKMRNVFLISTLDVNISDSIHTNSSGNVTIGQRAASAALGGVYGKDVKFRHPNCVAARRQSAKRIELVFDDVDERLHYENAIPAQFAFEVRDRGGAVPVEGWALVGANRLQIRLSRPLKERAVVVGAPGAYPPSVVPQDISGHRPMLGFTQVVEGGVRTGSKTRR
jgi:hypothetical protein